MNKIISKITDLQKKIKHHLFEKKIKKKQTLFERQNKRKMDDDELKNYKFYLFTVYSSIIVVPLLFLISM